MEKRNQKVFQILFIFSREFLDEERLSMSRILVRRNRGEFKYNYIGHLIVKLKYLSAELYDEQ